MKPLTTNKRVSLADIAHRAAVSVSTVSHILRDTGTFPAATRRRVKATARSLGYRPNPLLAALASKHFRGDVSTETPLAYLHPQEKTFVYTIFPADFENLQNYSRTRGYRLELYHPEKFRSGAHATQVLHSRGVQGIILSPLIQASMLPGMDWSRFSIVGWGECMPETVHAPRLALFRAHVDHFHGVLRAWDEVAKRGYERIGVALFELRPGSTDDLLRWSAVQACLLNSPPAARIPAFTGKLKGISADHNFNAWLKRHRPDAVIGFHIMFLDVLHALGYRVPQDIGFASLHASLTTEAGGSQRGEAGIRDSRFESMKAAVELIDQQLRHHQFGLPQQGRFQLIQPEWDDGETLPCRLNNALNTAVGGD